MIRQDPILIAAPPRSGTTMLAGLLYYHGMWVGRSRTTMYPGTNSEFGSENIDIKNIMKKRKRRETVICERANLKVTKFMTEDSRRYRIVIKRGARSWEQFGAFISDKAAIDYARSELRYVSKK